MSSIPSSAEGSGGRERRIKTEAEALPCSKFGCTVSSHQCVCLWELMLVLEALLTNACKQPLEVQLSFEEHKLGDMALIEAKRAPPLGRERLFSLMGAWESSFSGRMKARAWLFFLRRTSLLSQCV